MRSKTIEFAVNGNTVKVTVHTDTGDAFFDRQILYMTIGFDATDIRQLYRWSNFARALSQSDVDGDLGFQWPTVSDGKEVLQAARDCWGGLPAETVRQWVEVIDDVDRAPGSPDLAPEVPEKKDETPQ
jgi:hypothetical protein